jgi:hypothetical protein
MADAGRDVDIVERALAILDEESRAWVTWQRGLAGQAEGTSALTEPEQEGRPDA